MPPPKCDSEESNWNENLYLHQYLAMVQFQVPLRQPPLGWSNWGKAISTALKDKSVNTDDNADNPSDEMLQTAKPQEKGQEKLQIVGTVSISKEAFKAIEQTKLNKCRNFVIDSVMVLALVDPI